jgi:hypothetical protein
VNAVLLRGVERRPIILADAQKARRRIGGIVDELELADIE